MSTPALALMDSMTLWSAAQAVRQRWPHKPARPEDLADLLTGHWAKQIQASPSLQAECLSLVAEDPELVLLAVTVVGAVAPAQFRVMFRTLVTQTEAVGYAPMLAWLWTHATRAQRAALTPEDLQACTRAPARDLRLYAITDLLPTIAASTHAPDGRDGQTTATGWGAQLRAGIQRVAAAVRPASNRRV